MRTTARIPCEGGREESILEWLRRTDVCLLLDNGGVRVDQSQFTTKHMPPVAADPGSAVVPSVYMMLLQQYSNRG